MDVHGRGSHAATQPPGIPIAPKPGCHPGEEETRFLPKSLSYEVG
jgi:hypothetical protein